MSRSPKKVLVTGATGFIGSQTLFPLIERGFEVHALSRERQPAGPVKWHTGDFLDHSFQEKLLSEVQASHLLHMAWYVAPGKYNEAPENKVWLDRSASFFKSFAKHGGERIVAAGSCFEYDWSEASNKPLRCSESTTPIKPQSFYGQCKNKLRETLAQIPLAKGFAWGRIFYLYGLGEAPARLVPALIRAVKNDETLAVWAPRLVRDYLNVKDVGSAFAAVLDSNHIGPVNVASGVPLKLDDFVKIIGHLLNKQPVVKAQIVDPPLTPTSPLEFTADTDILNSKVGWRPHYDLLTGLKEMI